MRPNLQNTCHCELCHCWSFEDGGVCSQVKAKLGEELSFVLRLPLLIALPAKEEEEEALLTYFWSWEEGGRGKRTGGQIRQHRPRLLRGGKLRARRSSWSCQAVDFRAKSSGAFFFSLKRDSCGSLYIEVTLPAFSFTVQNFSSLRISKSHQIQLSFRYWDWIMICGSICNL